MEVLLAGVPTWGVIDSGADITIMGGDLFCHIAAATRMKKRQLQAPDRTPRTYDQRPFSLDGKVNLDISFGDITMSTPVYIKLDAPEPLLLAEGVCRQLNILSYHPLVSDLKTTGPKLTSPSGIRKDTGAQMTEVPLQPLQPSTTKTVEKTEKVSVHATVEVATQTETGEGVRTTAVTHVRGPLTPSTGTPAHPGTTGCRRRRRRARRPRRADGDQVALGNEMHATTEAAETSNTGTCEQTRTGTWSQKLPLVDVPPLDGNPATDLQNRVNHAPNTIPTEQPPTPDLSEHSSVASPASVRLVQSIRVAPHQSTFAEVQVSDPVCRGNILMFRHDEALQVLSGLSPDDAVIDPSEDMQTEPVPSTSVEVQESQSQE